MKKIITLFLGAIPLLNSSAQSVSDTVSVGAGYSNQVWYSLENDVQASDALSNWDIALATTSSQSSDLTTAIHFNFKIGSLYEIPGSSAANFATADTTGLSTWTPLSNSDSTWTQGAFNRTTFLGGYDYGWGSYNTSTHNIEANRVFVIKYNGSPATYKKMHISLNAMTGTYTLTYANLDNTMQHTHPLNVATYSSKNFVYFSLTTNSEIDREPIATNWDLLFGQYASHDYNPPYTVTGVLHNHGVEAVKVHPVNDSSTFNDWSSQTFTNEIDEIGYNWKAYTGTWVIEDSTVYFVKTMNGDIWKMVFTGFGGSGNGNFIFTKEKMSSVGVSENDEKELFFTVYPNPSTDNINITSFANEENTEGSLTIADLTGKIILSENIQFANGTFSKNMNVSNFSSGIYLVSIITSNQSITQKLIIK